MPHSIMRVDIAGRDVSRYLRLLLRKEGADFHTSAEFEIVRTIKEVMGAPSVQAPQGMVRGTRHSHLRGLLSHPQRACYLSINPQKDEALETEKVQYTLPDGSTLDVSGRPARG